MNDRHFGLAALLGGATAAAAAALIIAMASATAQTADAGLECDPDNGGIELPDGYCALVVADQVGRVRHIAVNDNGDLYAVLRESEDGNGIVALRDTSGDGRADQEERFGDVTGTGLAIRDGYLYVGPETEILRYRLADDELAPADGPETVVQGFPVQRGHASKTFTFDNDGGLYVNVGGPSNACMEQTRTVGSPGLFPCPQLERQGGIWRFDADALDQHQDDGEHYATGIRHAVAIDWNPDSNQLYVVQHGRDQLSELWPERFTVAENAELPAEEFLLVEEGSNFGWPYCYYDHHQGHRVLAPEFGGDGEEIGDCHRFGEPVMAFPAHWAPNGLMFYTGDALGERYRGGAFVAFHGSWNRAPFEQRGYKVVFVPFDGDLPTGDYEVFADGFAGDLRIATPQEARYRPMGLAQGPNGEFYISDSVQGRIWRVIREG